MEFNTKIFLPFVTILWAISNLSTQAQIKPSDSALVIPIQESVVSILYNPSNSAVIINNYGIRWTSDSLVIDLGNVDFGVNNYNRIWVSTSNVNNISDNSKFSFYLNNELVQPKLNFNIPLNIAVDSFNNIEAPQSGMFFKNPLPSLVEVFDVQNDDNISKMVSCVIQGVLNQTQAHIYLNLYDHHLSQLKDANLNYSIMDKYNNVKYAGFGSLIKKYKDSFDKLIVWTEDKDWTWCIAQMLAAQQNGIPVTQELKDFILNEFGWDKEIYDIRDKWANKTDAYQWALENLKQNCHRKLSFSAGLRSDYKENPWVIYDYAAASKGFVFFLNEKDDGDKAILENIFQTMNYTVGSSTMGYGADADGDGLNSIINKYNVGFVVSDYYANGSFWCSFPSRSFKQRKGRAIDAQPGKVYVSFIWSDGDNVQFDANILYKMFKNAKRRGEIPIGITMAPGLQELNPKLLEFFYKNRTDNDELMAGPSGFQFIYGDSYNNSTYDAWLALNKQWVRTAGFHTACVWNTADQEKFNRYMSACGLQGVFNGWDTADNKYINNVVSLNQGTHCFNEGDVYNDLSKISPNSSKPIFRNLYLIANNYGAENGYEKLIKELERLETDFPDRYVYLLPMDLCATLKRYIDNNVINY